MSNLNWLQRLTALDGKRRFALAAAGSHKEEVGRLRLVSCIYLITCLFRYEYRIRPSFRILKF